MCTLSVIIQERITVSCHWSVLHLTIYSVGNETSSTIPWNVRKRIFTCKMCLTNNVTRGIHLCLDKIVGILVSQHPDVPKSIMEFSSCKLLRSEYELKASLVYFTKSSHDTVGNNHFRPLWLAVGNSTTNFWHKILPAKFWYLALKSGL